MEQDNEDGVQEPAIHIGCIVSGDTVMKSGEDRDSIAKQDDVIAFEMEGAGLWDEVPCHGRSMCLGMDPLAGCRILVFGPWEFDPGLEEPLRVE